jgi:hypothetical protein
VPRHGSRVVRGPAGRRAAQPGLRGRQGRPGGAPRRRRRLHPGRRRPDGAGRLAAVRVHHPGRAALLHRHVLPGAPGRRDPRLHPGPRRRRHRVGRAAGRRTRLRRADRRAPDRLRTCRDPTDTRRRCPRRAPHDRVPDDRAPDAGPPRCRAGAADRRVRRGARRLRWRPEVPAVHGAGLPRPPPRPHRRPAGTRHAHGDVPGHGRRRHPRPAARRVRPLLGRRRLGRPPLREDAVRQRAAGLGLPRLVAADRAPARRAGRACDRDVPAHRPAHPPGRLRRLPRRRHGAARAGRAPPRRGCQLRVDPRRARRRARGVRRGLGGRPARRHHRGHGGARRLHPATHPRPRRPGSGPDRGASVGGGA